jgi:hypothetical protein
LLPDHLVPRLVWHTSLSFGGIGRPRPCTAAELNPGREDMDDQAPAGVVVSSASWSEVKPMPRLRRPETIAMRSPDGAAEPVQRRDDEGVAFAEKVEGLPQLLALGVSTLTF